jgi:Ca2+:H+ antiporter
MSRRTLPTLLRQEWFLAFSLGTCAVLAASGEAFWSGLSSWPFLVLSFAWLIAAILGAALSVVRHAEQLAHRLGEPYGTLVLTLSVTVIEVTSIAAVMLHGEANPTLARDTLLAVIMIILNGMVGLSLLAGGLRHREQHHNLQGANIYLSAVIPLTVLSLVLPDFTQSTHGPTLSFAQQVFLIVVSIGLYGTFLAVQTGRHSHYFSVPQESALRERAPASRGPIALPAFLLMAHLAPALFLAERLSRPVDYLVETLHAPAAVGGVLIAILVATPEGIGAVRAALDNQLQRSVNIFLGSLLSTIGLTIPAMVLISELTGQHLVLGVQNADLVLLLLTLGVSMVTFASGRTNIIQGMVHLVLFAAYFLLIFQN